MRCAHCRHRLLDRKGDVVKLRSPVVIFSSTGTECRAVCPSCKGETEIPLTLDPSAIPVEPKIIIERVRAAPVKP